MYMYTKNNKSMVVVKYPPYCRCTIFPPAKSKHPAQTSGGPTLTLHSSDTHAIRRLRTSRALAAEQAGHSMDTASNQSGYEDTTSEDMKAQPPGLELL